MGQDGGEQAGSDPQEQNPQEISSQDDGTRPDDQQETNSSTTGNYEANREDRAQKPTGWFKEQHPVPPAGDSNRQHLYAHNPPISDDEFAEALHAFNNSIANAETGERDSLATHQRPCTPPIEKARRQMQSLEEQGVQFTEDLEKEIIDKMIHSMGLVPALAEWCGSEADIPVEYANELLKEIDRLKLAMAKQQRDLHKKLSSQMKSIEDYQAQKKGREEAEQEVERYKVFHNNLFEEVKTHAQTWVLTNGGVVESPDVAKSWSNLLQKYEKSWPPNEEDLKNGKWKLDLIMQTSHDNREKKKRELDDLETMIDEQMERIEKKKKELIEKVDVIDKLEGLDDSSIPSSKPSFEISRTPPGTEGSTPASSRSTLVEMGESKSLQHQVSDLQQKLDEARKDNERLQESNGSVSDKDSSNSWPEKGDKINTLEKENEDLKAKLEGRMKEMNELHQKIAKLQQTDGHQDQSEDMEASDTDSESYSSEMIEDLEKQLKDQQEEIDKNGRLTRRIAELQINLRHFDRQAQLQRNRLEELEASNTESVRSSSKEIKGLKGKLEEKTQDQKRAINKNEALTRRVAELQINERHFDRQAQAQRNKLEELEASKAESVKSFSEKIEDLKAEIDDLKEKLKEKTQDQKRGTDKNEALTRRIAELQINARHFDRQAQAQRNRLEELERVNFRTADRLVEALGSEKEEFNGKNGMSLVDRINYLNMATFFRTCNYVQLAIREKSHPMANVLMNDAQKWFTFCQEDLATMEPSVRIQMHASMHILNGARRAMITRNQEITTAGRKSVQYGMKYLEKYPEGPAFGQLRRLADTVIERTSDEQHLLKKVFQHTHFGRKRVQGQIRNDPNMKASKLHLHGLHSPLSPSKWDTGDLDEDFLIGKIDEGN